MATKADFYVGIGSKSEWIGSLLSEGDIWNIPVEILIQNNQITFEHMVWDYLYSKGTNGVVADNPFSKKRWPHKYNSSDHTDYVFIFDPNLEKVIMHLEDVDLAIDPVKIVQGYDIGEATEYSWEYKFPCMVGKEPVDGSETSEVI